MLFISYPFWVSNIHPQMTLDHHYFHSCYCSSVFDILAKLRQASQSTGFFVGKTDLLCSASDWLIPWLWLALLVESRSVKRLNMIRLDKLNSTTRKNVELFQWTDICRSDGEHIPNFSWLHFRVLLHSERNRMLFLLLLLLCWGTNKANLPYKHTHTKNYDNTRTDLNALFAAAVLILINVTWFFLLLTVIVWKKNHKGVCMCVCVCEWVCCCVRLNTFQSVW